MKVTKNTVVAVSYTLIVEGKVADKAGSDSPLKYIHGTGMLLPKFEAALEGKEPGDDFAFTLEAADGYGEYNPNFKFEIPKSSFELDGQLRDDLLKIGNVIPMLNSAGQVIQGTVAAIGSDTVTMDFNHPMAGKVLNFSGKVEDVREATSKELTEGLNGEYLPNECHCEGGCHHNGEGCNHDGEGCHHDGEGCRHEGKGCCHKN